MVELERALKTGRDIGIGNEFRCAGQCFPCLPVAGINQDTTRETACAPAHQSQTPY